MFRNLIARLFKRDRVTSRQLSRSQRREAFLHSLRTHASAEVATWSNVFKNIVQHETRRRSASFQTYLMPALQFESLEARVVLASAALNPVFSGSIFDQNMDGTGDNTGTGYYSGGQPTVGHGEFSPWDTYDARAVAEFDISTLAGSTIVSATINADAWYTQLGGPDVAWSYYTGDGTRSTADYHSAATPFETVVSTGSPYNLNLDVASELQALINGSVA
jgi:hypothetical protein